MSTIANGRNTPLNVKTGTVPDVGGGMRDWFEPMTFTRVEKENVAFQAYEEGDKIKFRGVVQPLSGRRLLLKPEGQRAWTWLWLHADPSLTLDVDDVVLYLGVQTRVMSQKDYRLYGYVEYELVQDWIGSGPTPCVDACEMDGGFSTTVQVQEFVDGGSATTTTFNSTADGGDASSDKCSTPELPLDADSDSLCAIIADGGQADTSEFENDANGGDSLI